MCGPFSNSDYLDLLFWYTATLHMGITGIPLQSKLNYCLSATLDNETTAIP